MKSVFWGLNEGAQGYVIDVSLRDLSARGGLLSRLGEQHKDLWLKMSFLVAFHML